MLAAAMLAVAMWAAAMLAHATLSCSSCFILICGKLPLVVTAIVRVVIAVGPAGAARSCLCPCECPPVQLAGDLRRRLADELDALAVTFDAMTDPRLIIAEFGARCGEDLCRTLAAYGLHPQVAFLDDAREMIKGALVKGVLRVAPNLLRHCAVTTLRQLVDDLRQTASTAAKWLALGKDYAQTVKTQSRLDGLGTVPASFTSSPVSFASAPLLSPGAPWGGAPHPGRAPLPHSPSVSRSAPKRPSPSESRPQLSDREQEVIRLATDKCRGIRTYDGQCYVCMYAGKPRVQGRSPHNKYDCPLLVEEAAKLPSASR
jgi:hypothetical protein